MNAIMLAHPKAGQHTSVKAIPGSRLSMDFVLEDVTVERQGEDLVFVFDDGSSLLMENFYVDFTSENLPEFEVDGQIVSGADFFATLGPDLAPAAGPDAARSARYNEMGNADLAPGIDHLDGLDMSIPGSAVSAESQLASPLMNLGAGSNSGTGGPVAPPTDPATGQNFVADVRAVMYNTGPNSADHFVGTPIFFKNADGSVLNLAGAPAGSYGVAWSFPADWDSSWLADPVVENGQLIFKLSPEGLQMLQQTGDDSFLRGFVTVTVTMNGKTSEYKVEVVGTQGTYFNSADYDEQYGAVSGLGTDYIGEYHQGSGQNGSYHITSSSKNNDIVLNDSLTGGSYVHASGNPDDMGRDFNTILMNKGVINTGGETTVTSYDGTLRVHGGVSAEGGAASNSIDMGKGQIHISNDSGHGVSASQGANTISGNQILVEGGGTGVYAESGGQNSIINTGDKTLVITGKDEGVYAYGAGSSNHISNQQGTVDITGQTLEGLAATGNGANYIIGKNVNITGASGQAVPGGGMSGAAGIFASGGSINEVTAINGDVTVKGHKGLEAVSGGSNDVSVEGQGNITVEGELFGAGAFNQSSNNTLTAEQGTVTVTASNGSALLAADGSNEVTGRDVDISGSTAGLNASGVGSNTVTGTGGGIVIAGNSAGVSASNNTGNTSNEVHVGNKIIGEGDTAITIEGGTTGMNATGGGRNEVSGTGSNVITVTGGLDGMSADGALSANSIVATGGTVNVTGQYGEGLAAISGGANYVIGKGVNIASGVVDSSTGQFESFGAGLFANKAGINEVTAINGDVDIKGLRGMEALEAGSNDVSVEGQGNITVTGQQFGAGALNQSSNNTLTAEQGTVTVSASNGSALLAADGSNEVTGRDVDISGSTSGLNASGTGSNTVTGTGGITISGGSSGVRASGNTATGDASSNLITARGDGNITISGGQYGITAEDNTVTWSGSNLVIAQGNGDITISGGGTAMNASGGGRNTVVGEGSNTITVSGGLNGMYADGLSSANSIHAPDGTVNVSGQYGVSATGGGANYIFGKDIDIAGAMRSDEGGEPTEGSGLQATSASHNEVTVTDGGGINISGHLGMDAASNGLNEVFIEGQGSVNVAGEFYGMSATGNGENAITAAGSVTVSITATGEAAGAAVAMWAQGGGSLNIISGGQNSSVSLISQNGQGMAMGAYGGGRNEISLGAGSQVTIQGSVGTDGNAASENKIVVSGSGNTVTVSGSVAQGSLNIVANADNTFTLVLQASSMSEFASRYADWLNGLTDLDFFAGLTSIQFQLDGEWSSADEAALRGALSDFLDKVDGDKVSFTGSHDAQPESYAAAFEDAQPGHDGPGAHDARDDYGPLDHDVDGSAHPTLLFSRDGGEILEGDAHLPHDPMPASHYETVLSGAAADSASGSQQDDNASGQSLAGMDYMLREGDDSLDSVLQPGPTAGEHTDGHEVDVIAIIDLTNKDALKETALPTASEAQPQASYNWDHGPITTEPEMPIGDVSGEVARQMVENS